MLVAKTEPLPAAPAASAEEVVQQQKKEREAMQNASRIHAEWDRKRIGYAACVQKSKRCKNTVDSPVQHQLDGLISAGNTIDNEVQLLISKHTVDGSLSLADVERLVHCCEQLLSTSKDAAAKQTGLQGWFRL